MSSTLSFWERKVANELGRNTSAVQGPQGVPSSKSIKSVELMLESLTLLQKTIEYINADYMQHVRLASLRTLVVERLFSKMRSRNPTPTVLEYAYLFGPAMKENVKQLVPEGGTLHFSDVPNIPELLAKSMLPSDQRILPDWRDNYDQPVVQVTVRNQSRKDNVGTLPLYAYTTPQPKPRPLSFTKATHTPDDTANSNRPHNEILFPARTVLALKPTSLCNRGFGDDQGSPSATSAPFFLGVTTVDIVQDQHPHDLLGIDVLKPTENDIFQFRKVRRGDIPKEDVRLVSRQLSPTGDVMTLSEETYEGLLEIFKDERDLCLEGSDEEDGISDNRDNRDSDDERIAAVCANSAILTTTCTTRGRHIRPPQKLDL